MLQQINLLKDLPSLQQDWFSASIFTKLCASFLIVLLIFSFGIELMSWYEESELTTVHVHLAEARKVFQKTIIKYPLLVDAKALPEKVSGLEKDLAYRTRMWGNVNRTSLSQGFSEYMQALALFIPSGIWLNSIYINNTNNTIALVGNSLKPVLIPEFMNNLSKAPSFKNKTFKVFQIQEIKNKKLLSFVIGTSAALSEVPISDKIANDGKTAVEDNHTNKNE